MTNKHGVQIKFCNSYQDKNGTIYICDNAQPDRNGRIEVKEVSIPSLVFGKVISINPDNLVSEAVEYE